MKAKYILSSLLLAGCTFFSSCEDNLDISQHGVSTFENFYKTDADAEEAIIACYSNWKDTYAPAFWLKNLLSDDCYSAGKAGRLPVHSCCRLIRSTLIFPILKRCIRIFIK